MTDLPFRIIESDALPADTLIVFAPSPIKEPEHPDYVPLVRRAFKIVGLAGSLPEGNTE